MDHMVDWWGSICLGYMWNLCGVVVLYRSIVNWWGVGPSTLGTCAPFYMWNLFGVVVYGSMVNLRGSICIGYKCIILYMKLIWCNGVAWIYGQWRGIHLPWVFVTLIWCSGVAWIYGQLMGGPSAWVYVKLIQCSGVAWNYYQLTGGPSALGICASSYMWNLFGVVVLHGSMVNWGRSICLGYMCIVLYMKLIWCNGVAWIYGQLRGVHLPWVYVTLIQCSGVAWNYCQLTGVHLPWVYVYLSTCETYLV